MKLFRTLFAAALLGMGTTAMAQATYEAADGTKYEFKKHAFLDLQGGVQHTLGEAKTKDLFSPNVQLGLGYQFSPVFGARIQANAWQSKGGWNGYGNPAITKDYKYKYVAPGVDFMFNLSNLFCGWNPKRVFNVTAFLGGGANVAFDNDEVNAIANDLRKDGLAQYELEYLWDGTKVRPFGRAGLDLGFRLSDAVSLLIEGNANILSDKYNSKKAGNPDWYFNGLLGLRINLGKAYTAVAPVIIEKPKVYRTQRDSIFENKTVKVAELRRDVFFTINSITVSETEQLKIKDVADYLKKYPQAKVVVSGYADVGTGNAKINARLAAGRADIVVRDLKEKYGIYEDRITYASYGDTVQPFEENDLNRVSICIADGATEVKKVLKEVKETQVEVEE